MTAGSQNPEQNPETNALADAEFQIRPTAEARPLWRQLTGALQSIYGCYA